MERRHLFQLAASRYQPLLSIISVTARKGHVSACNAGAMASPAGAPPRRPSKPGTTHHQGNGNRPLNRATKGFSTWMNFCIWGAPWLMPDIGIRTVPAGPQPRGLFRCRPTRVNREYCIPYSLVKASKLGLPSADLTSMSLRHQPKAARSLMPGFSGRRRFLATLGVTMAQKLDRRLRNNKLTKYYPPLQMISLVTDLVLPPNVGIHDECLPGPPSTMTTRSSRVRIMGIGPPGMRCIRSIKVSWV